MGIMKITDYKAKIKELLSDGFKIKSETHQPVKNSVYNILRVVYAICDTAYYLRKISLSIR